MNVVICGWNGLQIKVSQTVDLQLKSKRRLQMTVNGILLKLETRLDSHI